MTRQEILNRLAEIQTSANGWQIPWQIRTPEADALRARLVQMEQGR